MARLIQSKKNQAITSYPWYKFIDNSTDDLNKIWSDQKMELDDRILFHVENCNLLRRLAADGQVDAAAWADKCATADPVADNCEGFDHEDGVEETPASESEQLAILRDVFCAVLLRLGCAVRDLL